MGSHQKKGSTFKPAVPTPKADYNVTGDPNPDCTCNYFYGGEYNGLPYYRRVDGEFFIWFYEAGPIYAISQLLGSLSPLCWMSVIPGLVGEYAPYYGASGYVWVSVGSH